MAFFNWFPCAVYLEEMTWFTPMAYLDDPEDILADRLDLCCRCWESKMTEKYGSRKVKKAHECGNSFKNKSWRCSYRMAISNIRHQNHNASEWQNLKMLGTRNPFDYDLAATKASKTSSIAWTKHPSQQLKPQITRGGLWAMLPRAVVTGTHQSRWSKQRLCQNQKTNTFLDRNKKSVASPYPSSLVA